VILQPTLLYIRIYNIHRLFVFFSQMSPISQYSRYPSSPDFRYVVYPCKAEVLSPKWFIIVTITIHKIGQMNNNPRSPTFQGSSSPEPIILKLTKELRAMESPTAHYILCKSQECSGLRSDPDYLITYLQAYPVFSQTTLRWWSS
jgi:hypothetical protein